MLKNRSVEKAIYRWLKANGIKQIALADALMLSQGAMNQKLQGNGRLTAAEYEAACKFLRVPIGTFMGGDDESSDGE